MKTIHNMIFSSKKSRIHQTGFIVKLKFAMILVNCYISLYFVLMEPKDPITNPPPPPSPPSPGAIKHEILKSVVFGSLNESITSLGVVTSTASADATTSKCLST